MLTVPRVVAVIIVACLAASNRAYDKVEAQKIATETERKRHDLAILRQHII